MPSKEYTTILFHLLDLAINFFAGITLGITGSPKADAGEQTLKVCQQNHSEGNTVANRNILLRLECRSIPHFLTQEAFLSPYKKLRLNTDSQSPNL